MWPPTHRRLPKFRNLKGTTAAEDPQTDKDSLLAVVSGSCNRAYFLEFIQLTSYKQSSLPSFDRTPVGDTN